MEKSCCVFCLDTNINTESEKSNKEEEFSLFNNFLKLLGRYILTDCSNYDGSKSFKSFSEVVKSELVIVCEKCLKSVNSFCALYHDLETIKLLLNLQLWNLNSVIERNGEESSTLERFKTIHNNSTNINRLDSDNFAERFIECRSDFSKKCTEKLSSSYPKLTIDKLPDRMLLKDASKLPTKNTENARDHQQNYEARTNHLVLKLIPSAFQNERENAPNTFENISEASIDEAIGVAPEIEGELPEEDGANLDCYYPPLVTTETLNIAKTEMKVENILRTKVEPLKEVPRQSEVSEVEESAIDADLDDYLVSPAPSPKTTSVKTEDSVKGIAENEGKVDTVEVKRIIKTSLESLPLPTKEVKDSDFDNDEDYEIEQSDGEDYTSSESSYNDESDKEVTKLKKKRKLERSRSISPPARVIKRRKRGTMMCPSCPKKYAKLMDFKTHIRAKHPEEMDSVDFGFESSALSKFRYKCPGVNCDEMFREVHSLLLHYRDLHDSQINKKPSERANLIIEILQFNVKTREKGCTPLLAEGKKTVFDRIQIPPLEASTEVLFCQVDHCNRVFYSQAELKTHSKLHGSFTCAFCPETMDFLPELSMHEVRAHDGLKNLGIRGQSECKRCGENFSDVPNYLRHHASTHFGLDFGEQSCPVCKTYLISYEKYRFSARFPKIGSKCLNIEYLFRHVKNAHGLNSIAGKKLKPGVIRCEKENCSAYFGTQLALVYHLKADHQLGIGNDLKERTRRVCEECGKRCRNEQDLQLHLLSHSGPASWEFICKVCAKKCMTKQKLEEHLRVHTKEKPFVCELCGVKYAHRHNLRIHVKNKHGIDLKDIHTKK